MSIRFELVLDHDKVNFQLRGDGGRTLLAGLPGTSKIMLQNAILHVRSALRDSHNLVPHRSADGRHFLAVKDKDGSILAKSPHVATPGEVEELAHTILAVAGKAPIVDMTKHTALH